MQKGASFNLQALKEELDKKAREFFPSNQVVSNLHTDFSSRYSEYTGMVEPTAGFGVNLFSDKMTLRFAQPVNDVRGQQASLEYVWFPGAEGKPASSFQLSWDNDVATTQLGGNLPIGNVGFDVRIHWRLR